MRVLVHVVTFESESWIVPCLTSVAAAREEARIAKIHLHITDNASHDRSVELAREFARDCNWVTIEKNLGNIGFSGAHNQGVRRFLDGEYDLLLVLNPDCALASDCIDHLCIAAREDESRGLITPLILRSDDALLKIVPEVVDAAGMILVPSLRHFDRGSGSPLIDELRKPAEVFGGTGACLAITRRFALDALLQGAAHERATEDLYPELAHGRNERAPLFDEGFFAYREDADLCWRAHILGWKCFYTPRAIAFHRRRVVPENRHTLPPILNRLSVRNRFLLQIQNYSFRDFPEAILPGLIARNVIVLLAVILLERSSLPALRELCVLWRRAWERRRLLFQRREERGNERASWPRDSKASHAG